MKVGTITYVMPCYDEEPVLPELYRRLRLIAEKHPGYAFEFVFVNDGSRDTTKDLLDGYADSDDRVKVLHFANNRGHQMALTAGMDFATGDMIVTMDADLQDPPELVEEMLTKVEEGFEIIHMQRRKRRGETWFKRFSARSYYALMRKLTSESFIENCGDFKAFTQPVLKVVQSFRERHRYLRGIFGMLGFRHCIVQYDRDERFAGTTKYPLKKMLRFAVDGIMSFSTAPIKLLAWLAVILWLASIGYLVKSLVEHFVLKTTVTGWTSIIILMTFFTGIIIFSLSVIASYVARIFEQGQQRPFYWLRDARNIDLSTIESRSREVSLSKDVLKDEGHGFR
jgi:dolichol-phosphate mannosyltransferase